MNLLQQICVPESVLTEIYELVGPNSPVSIVSHNASNLRFQFSDGSCLEYSINEEVNPYTCSTTLERVKWIVSSSHCWRLFLQANDLSVLNLELATRAVHVVNLLKRDVFVIGSGTVGRETRRRLEKFGVAVKSFASSHETQSDVDGLKVVPITSISRDATIVIGSGRFGIEIEDQLQQTGFRSIITLPELELALDPKLAQTDTPIQISVSDLSQWWKLALTLSDRESVETLIALLNFRLTLRPEELKKVIVRDHEQWFYPQIVDPRRIDVFVDCGAYDGDTIETFKSLSDNYSLICGYEPSVGKSKIAKYRHDDARIRIHQLAITDKCGTLHFSDLESMGSFVSEPFEGKIVATSTLDAEVTPLLEQGSRVYLKIDVEGSEQALLAGSTSLRKNFKPVIGLAAYHKWDDLFTLPWDIVECAENCRLVLRHYTESHFETVLYVCSHLD
jgi:FkbM family methyltransferase